MALLLNYVSAATVMRHLLSVWFILQIALPFTAPSMTCDLSDLLAGLSPRAPVSSPMSTISAVAEAADALAPTAATDDRSRLALLPAGAAADVGASASSIVLRSLVLRGDALQPLGDRQIVLRV